MRLPCQAQQLSTKYVFGFVFVIVISFTIASGWLWPKLPQDYADDSHGMPCSRYVKCQFLFLNALTHWHLFKSEQKHQQQQRQNSQGITESNKQWVAHKEGVLSPPYIHTDICMSHWGENGTHIDWNANIWKDTIGAVYLNTKIDRELHMLWKNVYVIYAH